MQKLISAATQIADLNDLFRRTPGKRSVTSGVAALPSEKIVMLMQRIAEFNDFNEGNDPYGERDFGAVDMDGKRYFWKIDYYDLELKFHSPDPADPTVTQRILTLMLAEEY